MNLNKTVYNDINETLYHKQLDNGLNVYLLPKEGFNKTYVTISTPLGSNVTNFTYNNKQYEIPLGVAHFLEHKLFDKNGKDISEDFAINSASVNAYTMNNRTTYLFSCTENLNKNIDTLFDFVFRPSFTKEGIEKEIGIISQEIKMYDDDPNTKIYMGTLKNLFKDHPVKNDILGTIESINEITPDTLNIVHQAFYNPHNMIMFVCGNIDVDETIKAIETNGNIPNQEAVVEITNLPKESLNVVTKHQTIEHDILLPNCLLGIKCAGTDINEVDMLKKELVYSILFDILIGKSTENYQNLLSKGLINDTFGMDTVFDQTYGYILMGSNSNKPDELYKELKNILLSADIQKVDKIHFERTKKQIIGGFITALNNLEYIANQFTKYHFLNTSLFKVLNNAKAITIEDVEEAKKLLLDESHYTTFTINPKNKG